MFIVFGECKPNVMAISFVVQITLFIRTRQCVKDTVLCRSASAADAFERVSSVRPHARCLRVPRFTLFSVFVEHVLSAANQLYRTDGSALNTPGIVSCDRRGPAGVNRDTDVFKFSWVTVQRGKMNVTRRSS